MAKDAITVFTLNCLHILKFCIILPKISCVFFALKIEANENPRVILFFLARLHNMWFNPDALWWMKSLLWFSSNEKMRLAKGPSIISISLSELLAATKTLPSSILFLIFFKFLLSASIPLTIFISALSAKFFFLL